VLVSRVLGDITRGSFDADVEPYMAPLYECLRGFGQVDLSAFFDRVLASSSLSDALAYVPR
jgi:hypothetical protein